MKLRVGLAAVASITLMALAVIKVDLHADASVDANRPWFLMFWSGVLIGSFSLARAKLGNWTKVAIVSALFTVLVAHGLYLSETGQATNRAWVSPCILGVMLAVSGVFPLIGMLIAGRKIKEACKVMLYFIVAGISPTIAAHILIAPRWFHN
ncbi:MAG: hypothetical protein JSS83_07915 [Cyanobacteria bacterium SZAS LIN-3]|nr:hypothetical protein [Cyanobacteria bacterium SZAS LIN-3]